MYEHLQISQIRSSETVRIETCSIDLIKDGRRITQVSLTIDISSERTTGHLTSSFVQEPPDRYIIWTNYRVSHLFVCWRTTWCDIVSRPLNFIRIPYDARNDEDHQEWLFISLFHKYCSRRILMFFLRHNQTRLFRWCRPLCWRQY